MKTYLWHLSRAGLWDAEADRMQRQNPVMLRVPIRNARARAATHRAEAAVIRAAEKAAA